MNIPNAGKTSSSGRMFFFRLAAPLASQVWDSRDAARAAEVRIERNISPSRPAFTPPVGRRPHFFCGKGPNGQS